MVLLLIACRPPEAPERFEDMMAFGFREFEGDERSMQDLGDKMIPWMEDHFDLTAEGYEISPLAQEDLDDANVDKTIDAAIIGVTAGVDYHNAIDDIIVGMTWPNQDDIFDAYLEFDRSTDDDLDCFLADDCEFLRTSDSVHSAPGAGLEFWSDYNSDFRRIHLEDGTVVLLQRILSPEPVDFNVDWVEVHQQYGFSYLYVRDNGDTRRVQAIWADGEVVGTDAADGAHLNIAINNIHSAAEDLDAWLDDR
jgi:hypothetical protein